jgi:hypothetical protein
LTDAHGHQKRVSVCRVSERFVSPSCFHICIYQNQILYRDYVCADSSLGLYRTNMTKKRDAIAEPSSVKRRKLTDSNPSESQSPSQNRLTASERAELLRWLDKADKEEGPIFHVFNPPPARKGSKSNPDILERPLTLDGISYLNARWTITPMEKWLSMTKYKKLYVLNLKLRDTR